MRRCLFLVLPVVLFCWSSSILLAQTNTSTPPQPAGALGDPNNELGGGALARKRIYLSPGHGNYWHSTLGWIYQRPDNHGLIEDIHTNEIVIYYLQRYLYNAGATVFNCRERSQQAGHVVLDSLPEQGTPEYTEPQGTWTTTTSTGYGYNGGRYRYASTSTTGTTAVARWSPTITTAGFYPVWVWYCAGTNRATDALYRITHSGGTTEVRINQTILSRRWVWLGEFHFNAQTAANATQFVELSNFSSQAGRVVIADAVRFGAGNGSIVRGGTTSGKRRWLEAARYWLQYLGAPPSVYDYYSTGQDSSDDVVCRPLYADWQGGDLYLSIHTNATGGTGTDTFIHDTSPSPGSANLRRCVHRSVIEHIRNPNGYNYPAWVDRGERTANFGELREVDTMPAALIELAFHDRQTPDNDFLHEDEFRHLVARALYKGIVKYFADADGPGGIQPVYVPLPPRNFRVRNTGTGSLRLEWEPTPDNITATVWSGWSWVADPPTRYKVYRSTNGYGFDNGTVTTNTWLEITGLPVDSVHYFRVTALNAGGESLPSEVLTARVRNGAANILLVSGFDRLDRNVTQRRHENTFDYVIRYAQSLSSLTPPAGVNYHFDSASNEAVSTGQVPLGDYRAVLWISGEESTADETFSATEQTYLQNFLNTAFVGGTRGLLVSGAEIGWDLDRPSGPTAADRAFYNNYLGADYVADDAGVYNVAPTSSGIFQGLAPFSFDNGASGTYNVDFPDCLGIPSGVGSVINLTYSGTSYNAGLQMQLATIPNNRVVNFGFPWETITTSTARNNTMSRILSYLISGADPFIVAAPGVLSFGPVQQGSGPTATQNVNITNAGGGTLSWTATWPATWLEATSPTNGTAPSTLVLRCNTGTLSAGTYTTNVTIACPAASNNPVIIPVTFTIINEPRIVLNPTTLSFTAVQGQPNPAPQNFTVSNGGGQTLSWTATENATWLTLSTYGATSNVTIVTATVNTTGLAPGNYSESVIISGNATNSPQTLTVWLTLEAAPVISLAPSSFTFSAELGGPNPLNQEMSISNVGGSTLNWSLTDNAPWLTLTAVNGVAPSTTTLQVASNALAAGSYAGTITVTSATALNSPQTASVTLNVSATPFAPSGLTATAVSPTQINLAWVDESSIELGFRIERKLWTAGTWTEITTVPANTVAYPDSTPAALGTYYYRVRAYNASGNSAYSNEACATRSVVVDSADNVGQYTSLAIAINGEPHISYYDVTNGDLKYAYRTGTVWTVTTVEAANNVGQFSSLALGPTTGYPHIAYYDATNLRLRFARWTGTSWVYVNPDMSSNVGRYASLALDSTGGAHIAYYDAAGTALKYAFPNALSASGFGTMTVDNGGGPTGNTGEYCSLALDSAGRARIAYYSSFPATPETPGGLRYAEWDGSTWTFTAVDGPETVGQYASLALDSAGNPRIAYYDQGNGDLKYAWRSAGGVWTTTTVDSAGDVGQYASLGLDSAGNPKIAYYDATNGNLKVACSFNAGQTWYSFTVDSVGDVGRFACDPNSKISYYDATTGDLRYIEVELLEPVPEDAGIDGGTAVGDGGGGGGGGICLVHDDRNPVPADGAPAMAKLPLCLAGLVLVAIACRSRAK